jgi:ankyrin repeat protein
LNARDSDGCTALWLAAYRGDADAVTLILKLVMEKKYDLLARNEVVGTHKNSQIALSSAAPISPAAPASSKARRASSNVAQGTNESEGVASALAILDVFDIAEHRTPFFVAVANSHIEVACLLYNAGANIYLRDSNKTSPEMLAIKNPKMMEIFNCSDLFLNAAYEGDIDQCKSLRQRYNRLDVNVQNERLPGCALFLCTAKPLPDVAMLQYLLSLSGIDVDATTQDRRTALFNAACRGHLELCSLLVAAHANLEIVNDNGMGAFMIAVLSGHLDIVQYLAVEAGSNTNQTNKLGETPVYLAAAAGNVEMVELLIRCGADLNISTKADWWTPLMIATARNRLSVVQALVRGGASVNKPSKNKWTPLILAASQGYLDIVSELVSGGADVSTTNSDGMTAMDLACSQSIGTMLTAAECSMSLRRQDAADLASSSSSSSGSGSAYVSLSATTNYSPTRRGSVFPNLGGV